MPSTLFVLPLLLGSAFALQPPGQFHGDEPVARDGEQWLALRIDGDDAALVATTVDVRAVADPISDEPGQRTGLEVSSVDGAKIVMYLRGAGLRAGLVERAQVESAIGSLPYAITFHGQPYRIDNWCESQPRDPDAEQLLFDCDIEFHTPRGSQLLAELAGYHEPGSRVMSLGDDASPELLFAGDLDRDGQLDLIFDTSDHYNKLRPTLFLSSQALPGGVILEVAHYQAIGC